MKTLGEVELAVREPTHPLAADLLAGLGIPSDGVNEVTIRLDKTSRSARILVGRMVPDDVVRGTLTPIFEQWECKRVG